MDLFKQRVHQDVVIQDFLWFQNYSVCWNSVTAHSSLQQRHCVTAQDEAAINLFKGQLWLLRSVKIT